MGRAAEIARAIGSPAGGAEHMFLGMLHDGGWPVSVISHLVDLDRAEAAVLAIINSPGYSLRLLPRGSQVMATCRCGAETSLLMILEGEGCSRQGQRGGDSLRADPTAPGRLA